VKEEYVNVGRYCTVMLVCQYLVIFWLIKYICEGHGNRYAGPQLAQGNLKTNLHMNWDIYLCIYIYIYTCIAVSPLLRATGLCEQSNVAILS
jgi:hypothetical protein